MYGILFEAQEEAAFSNFTLWKSIGNVVGNLNFLSRYLTIFLSLKYFSAYLYANIGVMLSGKLIIMAVTLGIGMIGYLIIELKQAKKLK